MHYTALHYPVRQCTVLHYTLPVFTELQCKIKLLYQGLFDHEKVCPTPFFSPKHLYFLYSDLVILVILLTNYFAQKFSVLTEVWISTDQRHGAEADWEAF